MAGGRLFCFAMQRTGGSAENSCPSAIAVPIRLPQSPSTEGTSARRLEDAGDDDDHQRPRTFPASQPLPPHQEALRILRPELIPQPRNEPLPPKGGKIVVEIPEPGFERHDLDPRRDRPLGKCLQRPRAAGVVIASALEPTQDRKSVV